MDARPALAVLLVALAGLAPVTAAQSGPSPAIVFDDQRTSGRVVLVDAAQLPETGFVGLHDPTTAEGGALGDLVGSSNLLGPGLHRDIPATLHEPLAEPQPLIAVLYEDANGNRALDAGDGHGHHHDGQDRTYSAGDKTIGDEARVGLYRSSTEATSEASPLLVGALTATAALAVWAVRYR